MPRGSQHNAAKRRKEKERQARQAAKRDRRFHKGEAGGPQEDNDALVREYLGLPTDPEGENAEGDDTGGEEGGEDAADERGTE